MQARFLLGPAGSGKTFRCVAEARAELLRAPDGPPLIFLAPKQATFQIERQLLSTPELAGYSRLHILSFERLASFVFDRLELPQPELLTEEGRVMVLRALLARHHAELRIFRASSRLTGFATQLSLLLREFQRSRVSPDALARLAARVPAAGRLNDKMHDLALLLARYHEWLAIRRSQGQKVDDANRLLDLATEALLSKTSRGASAAVASAKLAKGGAGLPSSIGALWLDGFAEMTSQEMALLAALVPHCERATLAFCLDGEPREDLSWLSPWTVVGRTFARCRGVLAQALSHEPEVEILRRDPACSRFSAAPELIRLESAWVSNPGSVRCDEAPSQSTQSRLTMAASIRLVACPDVEAEATLAAREIIQYVQGGGRFRDCAILVRSLDGYHDVLRRVLSRYEIPFFLDRREAVAHHPLAELTRYALRTAAFDWRHEDWFGALKTGLAGVPDEQVDWLENEALKRGWQGRVWREGVAGVVPNQGETPAEFDGIKLGQLCGQVVPPFAALAASLALPDPNRSPAIPEMESGRKLALTGGRVLADAIRKLWVALKVESQLEAWAEAAVNLGVSGAAHGTVLTQMNEWLESLEMAFADEAMSLREWLPIVEAGLAGLSVGVIPPTLDQVLVGSVDRSRNPDLQISFVLGMNEGVFPATPGSGVLLTESDRLEMEAHGIVLGPDQRQQLGHERYFGYIAFTRARRRLVVTWATVDEAGSELNPSSFVGAIRHAVPDVQIETYCSPGWPGAVHHTELPEHILTARDKCEGIEPLVMMEEFAPVIRRWERARDAAITSALSADVAGRLYGDSLATSVSALEDFAACPFHFLAARGLRAEEREEFVVDAREKGSFQHEILEKFHRQVRDGGRQWRDLTSQEAGQLVRDIGAASMKTFRGGLMEASAASRFTASVLIGNLILLMETLVGWSRHYAFDAAEVEVSFGLAGSQLPAWRIELGDGRMLKLRGRIDRIDLCRTDAGEALVVICDYKSGGKQMDDLKVEQGLELQLLSYLGALTRMPEAGAFFGVDRLKPAGVFYVPLRARPASSKTRQASVETSTALASAFQHRGRFDGAALAMFDTRGATKGEQFRFKLNQSGEFSKTGNEALPPGVFSALVAEAETKLRAIGGRIFRGDAAVAPYRLKQQTACDFCAYRSVCRFDPWTMPFRRLEAPMQKENQARVEADA